MKRESNGQDGQDDQDNDRFVKRGLYPFPFPDQASSKEKEGEGDQDDHFDDKDGPALNRTSCKQGEDEQGEERKARGVKRREQGAGGREALTKNNYDIRYAQLLTDAIRPEPLRSPAPTGPLRKASGSGWFPDPQFRARQ